MFRHSHNQVICNPLVYSTYPRKYLQNRSLREDAPPTLITCGRKSCITNLIQLRVWSKHQMNSSLPIGELTATLQSNTNVIIIIYFQFIYLFLNCSSHINVYNLLLHITFYFWNSRGSLEIMKLVPRWPASDRLLRPSMHFVVYSKLCTKFLIKKQQSYPHVWILSKWITEVSRH